jgi:arylsulfatase A-like enzyme
MYQELLHVPLILWRGDRAISETVDCPVSILDIAPTALDILGIERPETMSGKSLTGLTERSEKCGRRALVAESPAYGPDSAALVLWPMKLVRRGGQTMLFDLERDPGERREISSTEPEKTRALAAILDRFERTRYGSGPSLEIDPETLEQLRSLGYLSN